MNVSQQQLILKHKQMQKDNSEVINKILKFLYETRGYDFTGNNPAMLDRRISHRLTCTRSKSQSEYFELLKSDGNEADNLIDVLTINVSRFFRDPLCFEYISSVLLPEIIQKKINTGNSLRVWSAGCSSGEEPYSIAILINEFLKKEKLPIDVQIFATDLDKKILAKASKAEYKLDSVKNIKHNLLNKYFIVDKENYILCDEIKKMVKFSFFDLLDRKKHVPAESIFGNFDIVLCRNVLIYFNIEHQNEIFSKLAYAVKSKGYMILGEAELPTDNVNDSFRRENGICKIFIKK